MPNMNNMPTMHNLCGEPYCIPCAKNFITAYFSLLNVNSNCINSKSSTSSKHTECNTSSPLEARKRTHIFKPKTIFIKDTNVKYEPIEDTIEHVNFDSDVTKEKSKKN